MGKTKQLLADMRQEEVDRMDADSSYEAWLSNVTSHQKSLTEIAQTLEKFLESLPMGIEYAQTQIKNQKSNALFNF